MYVHLVGWLDGWIVGWYVGHLLRCPGHVQCPMSITFLGEAENHVPKGHVHGRVQDMSRTWTM